LTFSENLSRRAVTNELSAVIQGSACGLGREKGTIVGLYATEKPVGRASLPKAFLLSAFLF
jgi:hypothetical protein